jgi:TPR repeat protein
MDTSAQTTMPQSRLVRRSAVRATIMDSARRIAARDGVEELSLTAVAAEAGFGQSTVFGHFRNKDELVLAILAEDLGGMAALMRENSLPLPEPGPEDEQELVAIEPASFAQAPEFSAASGETSQVEVVASTNSPWLDGRFLSLANDDHSEPEEQAPETYEPHEDTAANRPRVDAWLERRLRVFEHSLSDLERRMKETESGATHAAKISEQALTNVSDRVEAFERQQTELSHSLLQRVEQAEQRQRGATAEMRAAMNDVATRIEILEAARRAQSRSPERLPPTTNPEETGAAHENSGATDAAYAHAAQRAADAAAALADMDREPAAAPVPSAWRSFASTRVRVSRRQYLAASCAALLALVLGAFVAFYIGQAHGRELASLALRHKAAVPSYHHVAVAKGAPVRTVVQRRDAPSPLDRLAGLAQAGNAKAELLFGLRYLHGDGVAPNQSQAAQWVRRAAEQHDPLAQYWLGSLYEQGDGMAADSAEAVRWYEAAAGQGNRKAMHALGVAYAQGQGTQKDYSQAARWFTKAATLGLVNSQFNLAVLYERGLGVPQSLLDAYKWYAIAAAQGDQESRNRVEALKTQLDADALAAAERSVQQFQPQRPARDANEVPVLADLAPTIESRP